MLAALLLAAATAKPLTLCDIDKSLDAYDGKIVRVRARAVAGFEIFVLRQGNSPRCDLWLAYAGGAPSASISFGGSTPAPRAPLELKKDAAFDEFQRVLYAHMYPRHRDGDCFDCKRYDVTATFTGRIDVASAGLGYGHMNGYRARFVLESVSDVTADDRADQFDWRDYSTTPVKFPTAYLSGRVIAPDGKPVAGVEVNAVAKKDVSPLLQNGITGWAGDDGTYKLEVPPGKYFVSINTGDPPSTAAPFAATYANDGKPLNVANGQHVDDLDIRPRQKLVERRIPVRVVWPDGKPVDDANVWLTEVRNPIPVVGGPVSHTKADGTFELTGFEGIDYVVHANIYVKPYYKKHCAKPRTLRAGDTIDAPLTFVLAAESCGDD